MQRTHSAWKTILVWGLALVAVFTAGAFVGEGATGTCMFILAPYFAGLAAAMPILKVRRFGAGIGTYVPYALLGFVPLFIFDWAQSHALRGCSTQRGSSRRPGWR
jgi:hypothetical protein